MSMWIVVGSVAFSQRRSLPYMYFARSTRDLSDRYNMRLSRDRRAVKIIKAKTNLNREILTYYQAAYEASPSRT